MRGRVRPGDVIVRRFEIEREIGVGGMGTVFRARDLENGSPVAVKCVDIRGKTDAERFSREAIVLAELKHPGIVRYISHGKTERGDHYIAMEWLEGQTLGDRLKEGPLSVAGTVQLGIRVASALSEAHRRGIIHRDIKPPNLFLTEGQIERVKVLDFGVARATGLAHRGPTMTRTGALIGTPGYMAPEQARGEKDLDQRADVFALGSVLFECLTGKPPFSGTNIMAVLAKILLEEAPRVKELRPDAPLALDQIVADMLSKEPDERPKNAEAVVHALAKIGSADLEASIAEVGVATDHDAPTKPPALTTSERRVLCVVLAGQMEGTAKTLAQGRADTNQAELYKVVDSFEGQLEELMDGTLLISLTASGAATDLAARAARCALAIRTLLSDVPIVLATGRGVISTRMPVGEVIDRAALILSMADADAVRLDGVSAGLLEGAGFDIGTDASGHLLRGELEATFSARSLLGKPTKCVGRDRELITLEAMFAECSSEPVARAVLITGSAGIGKSRVRHEFLQRVKARCEEMLVLSARGDSLQAGSPFAMLAEAICRFAGVVVGEPLEARREKLRARIGRHLPREKEDRVVAFIGELANVPFRDEDSEMLRAARNDAMLMGDAMRAAWEDWLAAECKAQPVLLILEDLHWGDLPTVKFVDAALRNLGDQPIMVVAIARPEVHEHFPSLWGERGAQELRLGGLTKKASEKLVHNVLGNISEDTVHLIVERADGNPFYLEELVRAVASGTGDALPETVLGMVQARLDALGSEVKRVLRAASVFGRTFWRGGVLSLLGGSDSTTRVSECLDDAAQQEIVSRNPTSSFPGETEYSFRQTLVREAAYAMLTDHDRLLGHHLAGGWLEAAGETNATVLAHHFAQGGEPEKAVRYHRQAAEQALGGNDFKAVIAQVESAITSGAKGELLGALHLLRGEAHVWLGEPAEAEKHLERAASLLPEGAAPWYRAVGEVIACICRQGHSERLPPWVVKAERAAPAEAAINARVVCLARTAENTILVGKYKLAESLLGQIEQVVARSKDLDPLAIARVHRFRARRALHAGDPSAYVIGLTEAYRAFEGAGDMRNATNERMNLGFAYAELGEYAKAEEALRQAHASAKRMGLSHVMAWADNNLGNVLGRLGQLEEARAVEARAVEAGRAQGDPRLEGNSRIYLSLIALFAGDHATAEREARASIETLTTIPSLRVVALALLANALIAGGKAEEGMRPAREAMKLLEDLGGIEEGESLVRLALAEALFAMGDAGGAKEAIRTARDRLLIRSSKITEPNWRTSFLRAVPENARTLELAKAWT